MNKYHANINIPVPFIPYEAVYDKPLQLTVNVKLLNKEFTDWLLSLGLTTRMGRFFHSGPFNTYPPHLDYHNTNVSCTKINLIFDSSDSIMNWYEPIPGYNGDFHRNIINDEPILYHNKDKCRVIYSTPVNANCLVNGSIIHDLQNGPNNGQFRKCYSLFLIDAITSKRITWDEALTIFKPYIINNNGE